MSRSLWTTSALSTIAMAGTGIVAAQDAPLWQPQIQTIIGADTRGAYAALEGFIPVSQTLESVVFLDLRLKHDFSHGTGGDIGIGIRRVVNPDLILGGYAYLNTDRRDGHQFLGATVGVEAIATNFDAHVNVHLPFGRQDAVSNTSTSSLSLVGNQLLEQVAVLNRRDYASWGIEGEFGVMAPLPLPEDHSLRLHVGGYHFWDGGELAASITGGKAGFEYKIGDAFGDSGASIVLGAEVRHDSRDKTHFAGSVRLTIPLGETTRGQGDAGPEPVYAVSEGLRKRANERVRGDIGVRVDSTESRSSFSRVAIDAGTNAAFGLFFAADGQNSLGLGTLGDPTTIDDAVARAGTNDFVIALGGSGNLLTNGVTLGNGQTIIGGGQSVQVRLFNGTTSAFSFGGTDGTIQGTNPANPVLSLANGNTLTGITVTGGSVGVLGNNINGATLTNVTVTGAGSHGAAFTGTSTGVSGSGFTASGNGGSGLFIASDGTFNFTGTTLLSGNAVDGLSITGNGPYNFQTVNAINNAGDGIEVTSATGTFSTTGGTVSGNGDIGVKIDPIATNVVLDSISHTGGTSGIVLDDITGTFTVIGATTITDTAGPAIAISNSPATIRFGDITIARPGGDGISFGGTNGPVVANDIVITQLGAGTTGLDFSTSNTDFTARSVSISGSGAGSTGIDLSGTVGGSSVTITDGGTIQGVDIGVQMGTNGAAGTMANTDFIFGGGSITGVTASLDMRGLLASSGTYAFGSTALIGPQLFDATNIIFVGSAATGAGDGSTVNDLIDATAADAIGDADAVFVLVNDGTIIDTDADGFSLAAGQTMASFGNGRTFGIGGAPLNVTGTNVQTGAVQADPTGFGAATIRNELAGDTIVLGDGNLVADLVVRNGGLGSGTALSGAGIAGFRGQGITIQTGANGIVLDGATGAIFIDDSAIAVSNGDGIRLANTGAAFNFGGNIAVATGATGRGLALEAVSGTVIFDDLDITAGNAGIDIFGGSTGTFTFGAGSSIAGLTGTSFRVDSSTGTVAYGGAITQGNAATAILINAMTGGSVAFSGPVVANTGAANAVSLTGNAGGTISFLGGLDIDTTSGTGFTATGGGTIAIGGAGNSVTTTTGRILNWSDVSVGAGGVAFAGLTSSGTVAADAILLSNVDGGAFSGGNVTVAATSGVGSDGIEISGGSAATFSFGAVTIDNTAGRGIALSGANGAVTIASIDIDGTVGRGVEIDGATNNVTINGGSIGATAPIASFSFAVLNQAVTSTIAVSNLDITGNAISADLFNVQTSAGTINVTGGTFSQASGNDTVDISDSSATITIGADLVHTGGGATGGAVEIDGTSGTIILNGTITNSGGARSFDIGTEAAITGGSITFNGAVSDTGSAGVRVQNLQAGASVTVNAGLTVTNPTGAGVQIASAAGNVTFGNVTVSGAADDGIAISNSPGTLTFGGQTTITNPGAAGVDIEGTNGVIHFANLDIALQTTNTTGFDLSGAVVGGNISATDFDLNSTTAVGTVGVNVVGTTRTGVQTVRLGDTVIAGEDATIAGVESGVLLSSLTNIEFIFGDGEDTDVLSSIAAVTPIALTDTFPLNGTYNFLDVTLTGDTSNLETGLTFYYVDDFDDGLNNGSRSNPGTIAGAMLSGADAIILVDRTGTDVIDVADLFQGGGTTFALMGNQRLYSFNAGDTINIGGGAPANFLLTGISSGAITNPFTGTGAPELTTSAPGANTLSLANNNLVQGVVVTNGLGGLAVTGTGIGGLTLRDSALGGLSFTGSSGTASVTDTTLTQLVLSGGSINVTGVNADITTGTGVPAISVSGGHSGTVSFDTNSTILATAGTGLLFDNADGSYTFDGTVTLNGGDAGIDILNGSAGTFLFSSNTSITSPTGIGFNADSSAANVTYNGTITQNNAATAVSVTNNTGGTITLAGLVVANTSTASGVVFTGNAGTLAFTGGLDIDTTTATGLVATGGGTINIAASLGDETIDTSAGQAINLNSVAANITLDSVTSAGGARGIALDTVSGSFTVAGTTTIDDATLDGVLIQNSSADATFLGPVTILNAGVGADGDGIELATNTGTYGFNGGVNVTVNGAGAFGVRAQSSGTVNILNPGGTNQITSSNGTALFVNPTAISITLANLTSANGTNGISLNGASGSLTVTGAVNISNTSGAGIAIQNSTSPFTAFFNGATTVTNTTGGGVSLTGNTSASISFDGGLDIDTTSGTGFAASGGGTVSVAAGTNTVTTTTGGAVDLNGVAVAAGGFNLSGVSVSGAANGIVLTNVASSGGGAVAFGTVNLQNVTSRGVDISGTLGAATSFSDLDISLNNNAAIAFDLNGATVNAAVTANDFDVLNNAASGTSIGVDLRGATGGSVVRLGDTAAVGASSSIAGVNTGVFLNATTNLAFTYGDGESATDQLSTISAPVAIDASAAPVAGSYNFVDVNFPASPGLGFGVGQIYFVDSDGAVGGGDGSGIDGNNPMTLAAAEAASGAGDVIVLINNGSAITAAGTNADNTLLLSDGEQVRGFAGGPINLALTVPATIQLANTSIAIADPTAGGAATLTTSAGADVITLGSQNNIIDGFILDGDPAGALRGINDNGGGATNTLVNNMTIRNFDTVGIEITPSTNTTITNTSFTGNASDVLLNAANTTISDVTSTGATGTAFQLNNVTGTTTLTNVSITGAAGAGLSFSGTHAGTITATNVDISAANALSITGGAGTFTFDATSSIANTGGTAVSIANRTGGAITFGGTVVTNGATNGISVTGATGANTVSFTGAVDLGVGVALTGTAISLANVNTTTSFSNVDIVTNGTTGFTASGGGTVNVTTGTLSSTSAQALNLNGVAAGITFASTTSSGGTNNAALTSVTGAVNLGTGAFTGATGASLLLSGGSSGFTYGGTLTKTSAGRLVDIQSRTGGVVTLSGNLSATGSATGIFANANSGGTITFSGTTKTLNTGANAAVALTTNGGATINFTGGGLAITTTSAAGFNATGGGTVTVQGTGNTISSTTGTALNVVNTTIGAGGLTFQSISANGGTNGVVLNNTGTLGGLTVTGTGVTAGSGGTIQNISARGISVINARNVTLSNMNLINANTVDGATSDGTFGGSENTDENGAIFLQNATNISLTNILIDGTAQHGIVGNVVTNLDITNSTIQNTGDEVWESGIYIFNLRGTAAAGNDSVFSNTTIQDTGQFNIFIQNNAGTNLGASGTYGAINRSAMDALTMNNMTFADSGNFVIGDHVTVFSTGTANFRTVVTNSSFTSRVGTGVGLDYAGAHTSDGIQVDSSGTAHSDFEISGSSFVNAGQSAINISSANSGFVTFNVHDNASIVVRQGVGINLASTSTDPTGTAATLRGFITNNTISTNINNNPSAGINAVVEGNGHIVADISNNVIAQNGANNFEYAIRGGARAGNGTADLRVANNIAFGKAAGVWFFAGNNAVGETSRTTLNLIGNNVDGDTVLSFADYFLEQYTNTTFQITGLPGGTGTNAALVGSYVASTDVDAGAVVSAGGGTVVNYSAGTPATP